MRYVATSVTLAPSRRRPCGIVSRPISDRKTTAVFGVSLVARNASTNPSAVNVSGVMSASIPRDFNADTVAGPTAAILQLAKARASRPKQRIRLNAWLTPLGLANAAHSYRLRLTSAASRSVVSSIAVDLITGHSTTSAPNSVNPVARRLAWLLARVTNIRLPKSGRVSNQEI